MPAAPRRPRRRPAFALALALLVLPPLVSSAASAQTAPRKAVRGLAAITTGFLELPGHIYQVSEERGPVWGATLGFAQGLGAIVVRELVGVYELVTAPFPVPPGYQPILEPEYPWGYFPD